MTERRVPSRSAVVLLAAWAGTVLAHALAYVVAIPDPAARADVLRATGHAYWPVAVVLALGGALAALGIVLRRAATERDDLAAYGRLAGIGVARLAAVQLALFGSLEVAERRLAGVSPAVLLHSPAFGLGLLVQVLVAAGVIGLLRMVGRLTSLAVEGGGVERLATRRLHTTLRVAATAMVPGTRRTQPARGPPVPAGA